MRFIFWDHYNDCMGGIEKLIITLAKELSGSFEIVVIAPENGIVYKSLKEAKARFVCLDPDMGGLGKKIRHDDILIDFGTFREFSKLSKTNPKLLVWRVYPSLQLPPGKVASFLAKKTFEVLDKKNALFFMDELCHEAACKELKTSFSKRVLSLPMMIGENKFIKKSFSETLHITYIGRGKKIWKVKPVKKMVEDLSKISGRRFHIHIFTDTDRLFRDELHGLQSANIAVDYYLNYTMERLSEKLLELSDLHYSMGTAALEGAVMGIPTVIADCSSSDFPPEYKYRWFVEEKNNLLGHILAEQEEFSGHDLMDIIRSTEDPSKMQELSQKTHEKVRQMYSSEMVCQTILNTDCKARVKDVLKFMPSFWLNRLHITNATAFFKR